jgi:hypothetical protein
MPDFSDQFHGLSGGSARPQGPEPTEWRAIVVLVSWPGKC